MYLSCTAAQRAARLPRWSQGMLGRRPEAWQPCQRAFLHENAVGRAWWPAAELMRRRRSVSSCEAERAREVPRRSWKLRMRMNSHSRTSWARCALQGKHEKQGQHNHMCAGTNGN